MRIELDTLPQRLKYVRKRLLGMSQRKLGEVLGVSWDSVNRWERGKSDIASRHLRKIGEVAEVSLEWLIAGIIEAQSSLSATMRRGGVASGLGIGVKNEFPFPHIPDGVSDDVRKVLMELRTMIEQQFLGDFRSGGSLKIDGDIHSDGVFI